MTYREQEDRPLTRKLPKQAPKPELTAEQTAARRRVAKALTADEKKLIEYPPTPTTWICVHKESYATAEGERREILREYANAGSRTTCGFCAEPKPRNAELVWPRYQAALDKKEAAERGR